MIAQVAPFVASLKVYDDRIPTTVFGIIALSKYRTKWFQEKTQCDKRQSVFNIKLMKYFYTGQVRLRYEYTNKPPAGVMHLKTYKMV